MLGCVDIEPSKKSIEILTKDAPAVLDFYDSALKNRETRSYENCLFAHERDRFETATEKAAKIESIITMPSSVAWANIVVGGRALRMTFARERITFFDSAESKIRKLNLSGAESAQSPPPPTVNNNKKKRSASKKKATKFHTLKASLFNTNPPTTDTMLYFTDMVRRFSENLIAKSGPERHYIVISELAVDATGIRSVASERCAIQATINMYGTAVEECVPETKKT
jgi:hypothetical protein